jgi:hypothetical protein
MVAWYIAGSLEKLRGQLNALAPRRSKISDGGIGDAAHSSRYSDHNPTASGQVCARDFTHDPAGGLDCNWLAEQLVRSGDPRIKYIIWNRRFWEPGKPWVRYNGDNPHDKHLHLSVKAGAVGDSSREWALHGGGGGTPSTEDDMQLTDKVKLWDGSEVNVAQLLAGLIGRIGPLHDELVQPKRSKVAGSEYEAGTSLYVRQVDARTYGMAERLTGVEKTVTELSEKLDKIIAALPTEPKG